MGDAVIDGKRFTMVDLPGTYSLRARSAEEKEARNFILSGEADTCIAVCDAVCDAGCLELNLILVLQLIEITPRVLVCINLMDEARKKA